MPVRSGVRRWPLPGYLAVAARSGEGPFTYPFRSLRGPAGPFQMGRERNEGASLPIEPHFLKPPAVENAVDD